MKRTIVFGDVHGCYAEWHELLDRLAVTRDDRLISVGDLMCKGPSTRRTLELARSLKNLTCLVGNHELRFLKAWRKGRAPEEKGADRDAVKDMGRSFDELMAYVDTWPYYVKQRDLLAVHAGLRPRVPLERQDPEDLVNIRTVGPRHRPWYEFYHERKPVVFGHWVRREPYVSDNAIGLDTGCVYGGYLSAVVFPGRHLFWVKARDTYAKKEGW